MAYRVTTAPNIGQVLRISLAPSKRLAVSLAALHVLALISAYMSLTGWPLALVAAGVVLSAVQATGDALQMWPGCPRNLEIQADGRAAWRDGGNRWHECRVARSIYVSAHLVILGLRSEGWRARWLTLLPDSADPESLRQLRVRLRWPPAVQPAGRLPPRAAGTIDANQDTHDSS